MPISGNIGPRGDGYDPGKLMTPKEAEDYHGPQVRLLAETEADYISAFTITNTGAEPLSDWRVDFTFTGQFQSSWNGSVVPIVGGPNFRIRPPAENVVLAPGASLAVGVTGSFGTPPTNPTGFLFSAGNFGRPLALP